jgi:methionine-R-sulfoxide reductase
MKEKPSREELQQRLSKEQFRVTQENGTETPFLNAYWDNTRAGIYVDVISGEPLFSSAHQYDAGCGWPSFTEPISGDVVSYNKDNSHGMVRTEVRSTEADSHLGHVFTDGLKDKGGLRYCINSAALRFIPKEDLEKEGLGHLTHLFQD